MPSTSPISSGERVHTAAAARWLPHFSRTRVLRLLQRLMANCLSSTSAPVASSGTVDIVAGAGALVGLVAAGGGSGGAAAGAREAATGASSKAANSMVEKLSRACTTPSVTHTQRQRRILNAWTGAG